MKIKLSKLKKRKIIYDLAKKSIIFKPFVFKRMYRLSAKIRKNAINECLNMYNADQKLSKKEKIFIKRDMAYCRVKYDIKYLEYFLFNLKEKNHKQRKEFIYNREIPKYLCLLGTEEGHIILRDKYKSYKLLKRFYQREMIKLDNENDYDKFQKYIKKYPVFVKKPYKSSLGKGIKLIDSTEYKNDRDLFNELISEEVVLEEQIIQNEKMASLHPKSLNTIRIITYVNPDNEVLIHWPFIKIGQKGSFVDNGGAGGILALIDKETGIIISDGKDESNNVYINHPDTKVKLKGFQIPNWNEAINYAKEAAKSFEKTKYIGWDLALSKDKGWVIVEGNGRTQFYGQQMLDEKGKRKQFEKDIEYKKLLKHNKNYKIWKY